MPAPFGPRSSTMSPSPIVIDAPAKRRERAEHRNGIDEFDHGRGHAATLGRNSSTTAIASHRLPASFLGVSDVAEPTAKPGRVRKFDRPPPPHDWRWWVGGLGKTLIAAGLLMFGFVAYQLWGTGIETARAQNALENEFEDLLAGTTTTDAPMITVPDTVLDTVPGTTPDTRSDHRCRRRAGRAADRPSHGSRGRSRSPASRCRPSASTTSWSRASRSPTSRRVPATTRRPRCPANSATRPSQGTARPTASRSSTSTSSRPATRSSSPPSMVASCTE